MQPPSSYKRELAALGYDVARETAALNLKCLERDT